jgi:SPP1 family predicted phage head-tail adaptor
METGSLRHRVTLTTPGAAVPDGEGGYTDGVTTLVSRAPAAVEPANTQSLERIGANTVTPMATHLVTLRYLPGVTTKTQVVFHDVSDRALAVTGVFDEQVRHRVLVLACVERVTP